MSLVVHGAMDSNTDTICYGAMDPDMPLGSSLGLQNSMDISGSIATQAIITLPSVHSSDPNMVAGINTEAGHPCGLWWTPGTRTSP